MANTYTWTVTSMANYPTYQSLTDVVFSVNYNVTGTDGTNTATLSRSQLVTYDPGETFIPYANLTNDIVIGWVQSALTANGVASVEAQVDTAVAQAALPEPQVSPLPWSGS